MEAQEMNPQLTEVLVEISRRLAELRNVLILVGIANAAAGSPERADAGSALDKLKELSEAFNL